MSDRASKILGDARRRVKRAEQTLAVARNSVRSQEQIVARPAKDGADTADAQALLVKFQEAAAHSSAELQRARQQLDELSAIPQWKLNQ